MPSVPPSSQPSSPGQPSPKAEAALAFYLALGPGRSLARMAREWVEPDPDRPDRTVPISSLRQLEEWSRKYGWQAARVEYDRAHAESYAQERQAAVIEMNERHARMAASLVPGLLGALGTALKDNTLSPAVAVSALKVLTDLERTARGAPSTITENQAGSSPDQSLARQLLDDPDASKDLSRLIRRVAAGQDVPGRVRPARGSADQAALEPGPAPGPLE